MCTWTDSPDGRFVVDTIHDGRIVVAAGDSGEGFKYSALMGPVLADLAEGATPDDDIAALGLARFADGADEIHQMRIAQRTIDAYRDTGSTRRATGDLPL